MTDQPEHLVKSYEGELKRLRSMLTEMGGIVETQMMLATQAVMNRDAAAATRAVEEDPKVDALEHDIEQFVIRMLALRQPMAGDLRQIVAALKMTGDLERIGDYAANAAKRSIVLAQFPPGFPLTGLGNMLRLAQAQLASPIHGIQVSDSARSSTPPTRTGRATPPTTPTVLLSASPSRTPTSAPPRCFRMRRATISSARSTSTRAAMSARRS